MSKGSKPRPFSVSQTEFDNRWDTIFGNKKVAEYTCYCYNCNKDRLDENSQIPYVMTRMIVCPTCGNKRCPHSTDHRYECTSSNEPGQPGSRY
jgi:hypothetical protein